MVGSRPDRRDPGAPERPGVEPGGREPAFEERVDAVGRCEHQPFVPVERRQRELDRLERDRGELDHFGAQLFETYPQFAGVLAGAGHDDATSEQWPMFEPAEIEARHVADHNRGRGLDRELRDRRERRAARSAGRAGSPSAPPRPELSRDGHRRARLGRCRRRDPAPINTTSVPPARASAAQSVSGPALVGSSWPVTIVTLVDNPRCVTGIPA